MNTDANQIIKKLNLKNHIEEGYFKRTYQSSLKFGLSYGERSMNTAIYYLLDSHNFSCWHRLKLDKIWLHYAGSDLILHQINEEGILLSTLLRNVLPNADATPQFYQNARIK